MSVSLHRLEEVVGHRFKAIELLREALSHRSYASESRSGVYNERMEFLGDSILSAVVADYLYVNFPGENEGGLSKRKSHLVSRTSLAHWAAQINLGSFLLLGVGEESSGGRSRQSLLANALEALLGALYLDGGYHAAARFIRPWLDGLKELHPETDFKSRLQEVLQKKFRMTPAYEMTHDIGPDHDKTFHISVHLGKRLLGKGTGKSKKEAEQAAAARALDHLAAGHH